jgi:hypothetical protein
MLRATYSFIRSLDSLSNGIDYLIVTKYPLILLIRCPTEMKHTLYKFNKKTCHAEVLRSILFLWRERDASLRRLRSDLVLSLPKE